MKNKNKNKNKYLSLFNKFLFGIFAILSIGFVFGVNDLSIKGFVLQEEKTRVLTLEDENRKLELAIMELESYENLANRAIELKMVKVDKVDYISVENASVARK